MTDKARGRKPKSGSFYFRHSAEMEALTKDLMARENMEKAAFVRNMFNLGLQAKYGIEIRDNKPVTMQNQA